MDTRYITKKLGATGWMVWDTHEQECVKKFNDEPLAQSFARLMNYCEENSIPIKCTI
jgi:hypothetical protein